MKLSDLKPNPNNPRKITDEQLNALRASLNTFGDLSGIVWNRRTKVLSGAHQRLKVLPPDAEVVIEHKFESPTRTGTVAHGYAIVDGEKYSYREVDWDELTEKAANIAANAHGGEFENDSLREWIHELDANNVDLDLLGFGKDELADLMAPVWDVNPDEDNVPPTPKIASTKRGELWFMGAYYECECGERHDL